jgi:hypothetical protein
MGILVIGYEFSGRRWSFQSPLWANPSSAELQVQKGEVVETVPIGAIILTKNDQNGSYSQLVDEKILIETRSGIQSITAEQVDRIFLRRDRSLVVGLVTGFIGYGIALGLTSEYVRTDCYSGAVYTYHNDKALARGVPIGLASGLLTKAYYRKGIRSIGPGEWKIIIERQL